MALEPLLGLPLCRATHVLSMACFEFGTRHECLSRKGQPIEHGDYAIHLQCPWRIVGSEAIVVGSIDLYFPADESVHESDFDLEKDVPLFRTRAAAWLAAHPSLVVEGVEADDYGGFRLLMKKGFVLEVFPADSLRDERSEHWRVFKSVGEAPHFVVCGYGVEGDV